MRWWKAGLRQTSLLRVAPPARSQGTGRAPAVGAKAKPSAEPQPLSSGRAKGWPPRRDRPMGTHQLIGCTAQFETGLDLPPSRSWGSCRTHLPLPALLRGGSVHVCRDVHANALPRMVSHTNFGKGMAAALLPYTHRDVPAHAGAPVFPNLLPRSISVLRGAGADVGLGGASLAAYLTRTQHRAQGKSRCAASHPANS